MGLIAEQGTSDTSNNRGEPNVIWLQEILNAEFGIEETTVICSITAAVIAHHETHQTALSGYSEKGTLKCRRLSIASMPSTALITPLIKQRPAVCSICMRRQADVVVMVSQKDICISSSAKLHNLEGLKGHRLRTHGGVTESQVPFILNQLLNAEYCNRSAYTSLKSYQILDYVINGTM